MQQLTKEQIEQLTSQHYEAQGRGYKTLCPICSNHNNWITEDNGMAHCWNCDETFTLNEKHVSCTPRLPFQHIDALRKLYTDLARYYHDSMPDEVRAYLYKRGLTDETIDTLCIGYCSDEAHSEYLSPLANHAGLAYVDHKKDLHITLQGRITFPYFVDGEVTDVRGRSFGEAEPKYKSVFKAASYRGATYPYNWQGFKFSFLLTEGELKAALAYQEGFNIVAMPGITTFRPSLQVPLDYDVVILFDRMADANNARSTDRAIQKVWQRIPQLRVGVLPLLGENKMDVDSFLLHAQGGKEALQHIIDVAMPFERYKKLRSW